MAGKLQVEAGVGGRLGAPRLMREQHAHRRVSRRAGQRALGAAPMRRIEMVGSPSRLWAS